MEQARLFLACDLDELVLDRLDDVVARLKQAVPRARWCARDALHLTVKFFGTLPLVRVADIGSVVSRVLKDRSPFSIELGGLGAFPRLESARVLWAGLASGADVFAPVAEELLLALELEGFGAENRAFVPHVTLARFTSRGRLEPGVLDRVVPGWTDLSFGETEICGMTLYSSELTPKGPVYGKVDSWPFGGMTGCDD